MIRKTLENIAKGTATVLLAASLAYSAGNPFEGRKTKEFNVPGTTHKEIIDVTNRQLRNVDSLTQALYEDALVDIRLGRKTAAKDKLMTVRENDAVDGKIDNYEIIKDYVDQDNPENSSKLFFIKYKDNHYNMRETNNPLDPAYLFGQGYGYLKLGKLGTAESKLLECLEKTEDKHNKAVVHNYLGNVYYRQGNVEKAIEQFRESIKNDKDYPTPYFNLAERLYNKGQKEEALTNYEIFLNLNPNDEQTKRNISQVKRELKRD